MLSFTDFSGGNASSYTKVCAIFGTSGGNVPFILTYTENFVGRALRLRQHPANVVVNVQAIIFLLSLSDEKNFLTSRAALQNFLLGQRVKCRKLFAFSEAADVPKIFAGYFNRRRRSKNIFIAMKNSTLSAKLSTRAAYLTTTDLFTLKKDSVLKHDAEKFFG